MKRLEVIIEPTFWETPWAMVLYVVLFTLAALLVAYILFYIYRLRHKVDVEQQLAEVKLRFFTDISHVTAHHRSHSLSVRWMRCWNMKTLVRHFTCPPGTGAAEREAHVELVNQLLDFRKIQSRKMKLVVEETDAVSLLTRLPIRSVCWQENTG